MAARKNPIINLYRTAVHQFLRVQYEFRNEMQYDKCSEKLTETNPCQGHNMEGAAFSQAFLQQQEYNLQNTTQKNQLAK
jgi:hypothetical protein